MAFIPISEAEAKSQSLIKKRFACLVADSENSAERLRLCPVVTANGELIGRVKSMLVDLLSRQLRYVVLHTQNNKATVVIPWQLLYFDSSLVRLVYYTYSD